MAYSELIKNFDRIRDYMRGFYVYGFKSREEYDASARSYDNERRRIESWLDGRMRFRQDAAGKRMFLSVDSRRAPGNPLHKAFRAKSFTDKDITLHFYLLDLLADGAAMTAGELTEALQERCLAPFAEAFVPDESTVRKKLREYADLGLLTAEKQGRTVVFRRAADTVDLASWQDALGFYTETDPLGVIGTYLQRRLPSAADFFRFKHHYILHTLDSEVLCALLQAIGEHRTVELQTRNLRTGREHARTLCPLRVYVSTQTGRQYLFGYHYQGRRPMFLRLDAIRSVKLCGKEERFAEFEGYWRKFDQNLWGVSAGETPDLDHIELTLHVEEDEDFILQRLTREKRHGTVEVLDAHTVRFTADVYDAAELLPWLRTFIGRIERLRCTNQHVMDRFYGDLAAMAKLYGGESDAVP